MVLKLDTTTKSDAIPKIVRKKNLGIFMGSYEKKGVTIRVTEASAKNTNLAGPVNSFMPIDY